MTKDDCETSVDLSSVSMRDLARELKRRCDALFGQPIAQDSGNDHEVCAECGTRQGVARWNIHGRWYCNDCKRAIVDS